jgi:predicted MFS family arabinose efflux permease
MPQSSSARVYAITDDMTGQRMSGSGLTLREHGLVAALGIAQIVAWGTLYYAIAILGSSMADSFGWPPPAVFGAFSLSLVVSGAVAPSVGRRIDGGNGRSVLVGASVLAAAGLFAVARAEAAPLFYAGWLLVGAAMGAGLYDAVFAVLHTAIAPRDYRRAVTVLTLYGGFASTVFWPLSHELLGRFGWRSTLDFYAALQLLICLPLYLCVPGRRHRSATADSAVDHGTLDDPRRAGRVRWLAAGFALAAFNVSVLSVHLVDLLHVEGLTRADAIAVGSLIGPMQVVARACEFVIARSWSARTIGSLAFALLTGAILLLNLAGRDLWLGVLFAMLYGSSNGIMTIIRGTVPAELFGRAAYGALLGRLAAPAFAAKAIAPFAFAALLTAGSSTTHALLLLLAVAATAWGAYEVARRR